MPSQFHRTLPRPASSPSTCSISSSPPNPFSSNPQPQQEPEPGKPFFLFTSVPLIGIFLSPTHLFSALSFFYSHWSSLILQTTFPINSTFFFPSLFPKIIDFCVFSFTHQCRLACIAPSIIFQIYFIFPFSHLCLILRGQYFRQAFSSLHCNRNSLLFFPVMNRITMNLSVFRNHYSVINHFCVALFVSAFHCFVIFTIF